MSLRDGRSAYPTRDGSHNGPSAAVHEISLLSRLSAASNAPENSEALADASSWVTSETLAGVTLSDAVMPGVVNQATGAWYDPAEPGKVGTLDKHGNPNVLPLDRGTSHLAQGPLAHSTLVEVARFDEALPEITAFTGPVAEAS